MAEPRAGEACGRARGPAGAGKEFILKNVTADIEPGDSEDIEVVSLSFDVPRDPLERFRYKIVDPSYLNPIRSLRRTTREPSEEDALDLHGARARQGEAGLPQEGEGRCIRAAEGLEDRERRRRAPAARQVPGVLRVRFTEPIHPFKFAVGEVVWWRGDDITPAWRVRITQQLIDQEFGDPMYEFTVLDGDEAGTTTNTWQPYLRPLDVVDLLAMIAQPV